MPNILAEGLIDDQWHQYLEIVLLVWGLFVPLLTALRAFGVFVLPDLVLKALV